MDELRAGRSLSAYKQLGGCVKLESLKEGFGRDSWCLTALQTSLQADLSGKRVSCTNKQEKAFWSCRTTQDLVGPPVVPQGAQDRQGWFSLVCVLAHSSTD